MTNDFILFPDTRNEDPDVDSDVALITAYLARELSLVQIVAVEERLANDAEFFDKVRPLIEGWTLPGAAGVGDARILSSTLTSAEIEAGWQRPHGRENRAQRHYVGVRAAPRAKRVKISVARIAAVIALIVFPMVGIAQVVLYAARHADVPGHDLARRITRTLATSATDDATQGQPIVLTPSGQAALSTQAVPIVDLSAPTAKTTQTIGAVLGLKEAPDGRLLVNDALRRQVLLFESNLASSTIVLDSVPGSATSYGPQYRSLIQFRGDSSGIYDNGNPPLMRVLDARGQVARILAPVSVMAGSIGASGVDTEGRLIFRQAIGATNMIISDGKVHVFTPGVDYRSPGWKAGNVNDRDSLAIHREDFETRRIDTIGYVTQPSPSRTIVVYEQSGPDFKRWINPMPVVDDWAVLSDGTLALVRGHDYHVDWIHPDGTKSSTSKLPFDWKRVTDEDKQRMIDSARTVEDSLDALNGGRMENGLMRGRATGTGGGGARGGGGVPSVPSFLRTPGRESWKWEVVPISKIADYYPPIRAGAAKPDRDGNLWILPATSAQSTNGELIYDVVNPKRGFVQRVRLPVGRSIAGFGKGGVVYLQAGDMKNGFILERTRVPGAKPAPK